MKAAGELSGTEVACLSGGGWAAVRAGLAMLYARGVLVSGRTGQLSRTGAAVQRGSDPLERALYGALYGSMAPRELARHPRVHRALGEVRRSLSKRGLLRPLWRRVLVPATLVIVMPLLIARLAALQVISIPVGLVATVVLVGVAVWFLPRRTVGGARLLRTLRLRYAELAERPATAPAEVGLAVGLFGASALVAAMPQFARDAGLLDGGRRSHYLGDASLSVSTDASSSGSSL
ncbi:MAG TPA: TIGR04222 domain-containing membrane protein [Micromonosporaceae bacterium]|nr:TIGR04222 domain-containing membrane protein [Micromonosporaceae bacterium]